MISKALFLSSLASQIMMFFFDVFLISFLLFSKRRPNDTFSHRVRTAPRTQKSFCFRMYFEALFFVFFFWLLLLLLQAPLLTVFSRLSVPARSALSAVCLYLSFSYFLPTGCAGVRSLGLFLCFSEGLLASLLMKSER